MNTYVTALGCALGSVLIHEAVALVHPLALDSRLKFFQRSREIVLSEHDHHDTQQGPSVRRLITNTATGNAIGVLQPVFSVGSTDITFRR